MTFRRNVLPVAARWKNRPNKLEASSKQSPIVLLIRWSQYTPPNRRLMSTRLDGVRSQKIVFSFQPPPSESEVSHANNVVLCVQEYRTTLTSPFLPASPSHIEKGFIIPAVPCSNPGRCKLCRSFGVTSYSPSVNNAVLYLQV
jgi:hypothetical protein